MADNSIYSRGVKIGERIKLERKRKKITQEELGEKLGHLTGEAVQQPTISDWESGKTIPPIDRVLTLSKIFGCDCGYLLCDYNQRTHDSAEICKATGLSERSIECLCSLKTWNTTEYAKIIDFLLLDAQEKDRAHNYRSILDLLFFFLEYDDCYAIKRQVFSNGYIADYAGGGISTDAIALNERIVENAVLMEIQQALISLKHIRKKKARGDVDG